MSVRTIRPGSAAAFESQLAEKWSDSPAGIRIHFQGFWASSPQKAFLKESLLTLGPSLKSHLHAICNAEKAL